MRTRKTKYIILIFLVLLLFGCSPNSENSKDLKMRNSSILQTSIIKRSVIGYNKSESSYLLSPPNYGKVLQSIASVNNHFVGVLTPPSTKVITSGSSSIISSDDGINWEEREFESKRFYRSISFSNNIYFAVGQGQYANSGSIIISTDSQNWQEVYTGEITLTHAFFSPQGLFALGLNGLIVKSIDNGSTWKIVHQDMLTGHLYAGAYGNNLSFVVGDTHIAYSRDGADWVTVPLYDLGLPFGLRSIVYGNNLFLIWIDTQLFISNNGKQWDAVETNLIFSEITFANDIFVSLDIDGNIYFSENGIAWNITEDTINDLNVNCISENCFILGKKIISMP